MNSRGSSPLSENDEGVSNRASGGASKFSINNLVSAENTATVGSSAISPPASIRSSPRKSSFVNAKDSSSSDGSSPAQRKRQKTRDDNERKENANGPQATNGMAASQTGFVPEAQGKAGNDDNDDSAEQSDDEGQANGENDGDEDNEQGGEEGDDDDDEEEEDDEEDEDDDDDDDDDEDDDASTGSRDLDEPDRAKSAKEKDGDVSMADASGTSDGVKAPVEGNSGADAGGQSPSKDPQGKPGPKPGKKRKQREPSVDVSLPKGPPPRPTVRVSLKCRIKDQGDYMNNIPEDIYQELKAKSHPWAEWYSNEKDSSASMGQNAKNAAGHSNASPAAALPEGLGPFAHLLAKYPVEGPGPNGKVRKRRKKRNENEEYDVNDPFVDDSELQIDEPTHSARPASKGFYVVIGDVELEKVSKAKRGARNTNGTSTPNAGASGANKGSGTGQAPPHYLIQGTQLEVCNRMIHLRAMEKGLTAEPSISPDSIPDDAIGLIATGLPAGSSLESAIEVKDDSAANSSKKKSYPTRPVDRRLAAEFVHLKDLVSKESFVNKARFPPSLRAPLRKAATLALELGEYTDNFFNYMPQMFPYNRFTMSKLIKREFAEDHVAMIKKKQDELFDDLREAIEEALPQHRADHEEAVRQWKQEGGQDGTSASTTDVEKPTNEGGDDDVIAVNDNETNATSTNKVGSTAASTEPLKRWRWTERMREDVFQIILIENGITELRMEKIKLENSSEIISDLNARKAIYRRLHELWPENEGWTTTTGISKEHAVQKKKHDRHNNALAEQAAG
ncbi:unnamed protein product [Sympodiomycopsis kandeliae]